MGFEFKLFLTTVIVLMSFLILGTSTVRYPKWQRIAVMGSASSGVLCIGAVLYAIWFGG